MDDLIEEAKAWCLAASAARAAEGVGARGRAEGQAHAEISSQASADGPWLERLEVVVAGMRLRRRLDGRHGDPWAAEQRRAVVRVLAECQREASAALAGPRPGTARHRALSARVRAELEEMRTIVRDVLNDPERDAGREAMALEPLRADVEWLGVLVARLDGQAPPGPTVWMDIELERLRGALAAPASARAGPEFDAARDHFQGLDGRLLERRVRQELAAPAPAPTPEAHWARRLRLSRLQARVDVLDLEKSRRRRDRAVEGEDETARRAEELAARRGWLADEADALMEGEAPGSAERSRAGDDLLHLAYDEMGELTVLINQMPPERAARRLELAREDLRRLGASFGRWNEAARGEAERESAAPEDREGAGAAAEAWARRCEQARRLERRTRREWQRKVLAQRMNAAFGRRFVSLLENGVLVLVLVLIGLIAAEFWIERAGPLTIDQHRFFAWADLAVCSVFLFEFAVKLALSPDRRAFFLRHLAVDLIPSLPFGFIAHAIDLAEMGRAPTGEVAAIELLAYYGRFAQTLRLVRLALPVVRLARVGLMLLRVTDRVVESMAGLLNRNVVLFEPSVVQKPESSDRHRLTTARGELEHARASVERRLAAEERLAVVARALDDFDAIIEGVPDPSLEGPRPDEGPHEVPVEAVVERLIQLSPEELVDRMGPAFVAAADRHLRLLAAPLVRRLPLARKILAVRQKSPAEAVALAANHVGHLIQRGLDAAYFLADLQGTLSPPIFLDRLGATIVNATRNPAKRLLWLGSAFLALFAVVQIAWFPRPVRLLVDKIYLLLGWPVVLLGVVCLGLWTLGAWFRKVANQSADFCERVVEAQFAAHTKDLKSRRQDQDARFLGDRVIDPELLLRSSDNQEGGGPRERHHDGAPLAHRELVFLRNVRLLYEDYLDGSPLHRSDTKASVQLLGNLALGNLRRSHLRRLLRESRALARLDLNRAGGLFGGPFLWFNYITRLLVQETAILILDYNRHAVPLDRLACSNEATRRAYREWLSRRLKIGPSEIALPGPPGPSETALNDDGDRDRSSANGDGAAMKGPRRRAEADDFLETVEFTAVDFLAEGRERDAEILQRFGPLVAELVRRDRQQNVRRAFRSFPLHELPASLRTINPLNLYETFLSGGRIALLPWYAAKACARGAWAALRSVARALREVLHPRVDQDHPVPADTYWAAVRKIHRMRKPIFMASLWMRAQFDAEYLGLPLPTAPAELAPRAWMESDLDYIGATRQDRIIAEQLRRRHLRRLGWLARWLRRFRWGFHELPAYLENEAPFLANRAGEALRALAAASVLDHDDIATLALSLEALERVFAHAAAADRDPRELPAGLPEVVINPRTLWYPVHRCRRPASDLFQLPGFDHHGPAERARIVRYLRRHRRALRNWIRVVLGQGGPDPWATVKARMREVLLRTDLWSDELLVLRTIQSLTMLDVQINCELVWTLGGYTGEAPGAAGLGPGLADTDADADAGANAWSSVNVGARVADGVSGEGGIANDVNGDSDGDAGAGPARRMPPPPAAAPVSNQRAQARQS